MPSTIIELFSRFLLPRVKTFRKAKHIYNAYIRKYPVPFHRLGPDNFKKAEANNDLRKCKDLYIKAIRLTIKAKENKQLTELHCKKDLAAANIELGRIFHLQGRLVNAQQIFQEALESYNELLQHSYYEREAISICHYHLGIIAAIKNNIEEAKMHLEKSLKIDRETYNRQGILITQDALDYLCKRSH